MTELKTLVFLGIFLCIGTGVVSADEAPAVEDARTLVQASVFEGSFNPSDRAATLHVLRKRGARVGLSAAQFVREYVAAFKEPPAESRRWIFELTEACEEPEGLPSNMKWVNWRSKCEKAFEDTRAFLRGELKDPCPKASQWGSRTLKADKIRAAKAMQEGRWIEASCAKLTANRFFIEVRPPLQAKR